MARPPNVAKAGSDWIKREVIEAPRNSCHLGDIVLDEAMAEVAVERGFCLPQVMPGAENWRMRDVKVMPGYGLAFRSGDVVERTRFLVDLRQTERLRRSLDGAIRLEARPYFLASNRVSQNYFHMIVQILPAIVGYSSLSDFVDGAVVVAELNRLLPRALELAGIEVPIFLNTGTDIALEAENLTVSSFLSEKIPASYFPNTIYDRMLSHLRRAQASQRPTGGPILYVWRADSNARPMRNEDELVERLVSRVGVNPIVLSSLDLEEQMLAFNEARIVIGPHGAGLANVAFCRPGSVLYELLPSHYLNCCPCRLALLRGLHYSCDVFNAEARADLWRHQTPWSVDVDKVERRLVSILENHKV